jgi:hypothetical protein
MSNIIAEERIRSLLSSARHNEDNLALSRMLRNQFANEGLLFF